MEKYPVTILLVEDDQSMLDGMKDLLEMSTLTAENTAYEATVLTAVDGQAGLDYINQQTPDLIISDIMMPRMTGYEFLHELKKNSDWLQIPFIFLTAKGEREDYQKGRLEGADLFITKPFDSGTFLEQITTQLHRSLKLKAIQRQHVEDLKKRILQILNHEFRTPLTYVTAYYEMLADGVNRLGAELDYQEYLRGIQAGCIRLTRLVEDFLLVISLMSGESEEQYKNKAHPISDVNALIQGAIDYSLAKSKSERVEVLFTPVANLPTIFGVRNDIENILYRVLDNALKFTNVNNPQNGKVNITVSSVQNKLQIEIEDEGIGFPVHMQNRIFDLFFQYNRNTMEQQGAGTGLTIVKGLVKLHNGHIEIESKEGIGSTFTIAFPAYSHATNDTPHINKLLRFDQKRATILAVEDDLNLLAGLEDLLETMNNGYELEVLTAENGQVGLNILNKRMPDLIISDIMMPQMSGFEFLHEVRKNPDWLQIPVIFLTARGEIADKNQAFISGVDEYITKPYDSDHLLRFVKSQLDRRFRVQKILGQNFDVLRESILNLVTPDFRQPLSYVTDYTNKLVNALSEAETDTELKDSLHGIQIGSSWLKRVIEDLMCLAELKTGEALLAFDLQKQRIPNIGVFLSEYVLVYAKKLANENVKIQFSRMDLSIEPILGDISTLSDSIRRLIEVGVRYTSSESNEKTIDLSVSQVEDEVYVFIQFESPLPNEILLAVQEI
ncbi:MAG: response regulator, partial [Chloroflexi bacterium]|nr:response regulator [Chloroflexota bacterium]